MAGMGVNCEAWTGLIETDKNGEYHCCGIGSNLGPCCDFDTFLGVICHESVELHEDNGGQLVFE